MFRSQIIDLTRISFEILTDRYSTILFIGIFLAAVIGNLLLPIRTVFLGVLITGLPVLAAAGTVVLFRTEKRINTVSLTGSNSKIHLKLVYIIGFILISYISVIGHRSALVMISAAFFSTYICMVILIKNYKAVHLLPLILINICILIYSVTLVYPYYYGATDILTHRYYIKYIIYSGEIIPNFLHSYADYPLYHILASVGVLILDENMFLILGAVFCLSSLFVFTLSRNFFESNRLSLLITFIWTIMPVTVFYGQYMITRTLSSIGFLVLFCLLINPNYRNPQRTILTAVILTFIILSHHASPPQMLFLLVIYIACSFYIDIGRSNNHITPSLDRSKLMKISLIFFLAYVVYIIYSPVQFVEQLALAFAGTVETGTTSNQTPANRTLWHPVYYISQFSLSLLIYTGIGIVLKYKSNFSRRVLTLAIFVLILSPLFIPSFVRTTEIYSTLRFDRVQFLLAPFIAVILGISVIKLTPDSAQNYNDIYQTGKSFLFFIIAFVVIFSLLTSPSGGGPAADVSELSWTGPKNYFETTDLKTMEHVEQYTPSESEIVSDYPVARNYWSGEGEKLNTHIIPSQQGIAADGPNALIKHDYAVVRWDLLERHGLTFRIGTNNYIYTDMDSIVNLMSSQNKVYANGDSDLYYPDGLETN